MTLLKKLFTVGIIAATTTSFAQTTLLGGIQNIWEPVQRPYFFWDQMRTQYPVCFREYRSNANAPWRGSNLMISRMENKRFVDLNYNLRNLEDNAWVNYSRWQYIYEEANGNISKQAIVSRYLDDNNQVRTNHIRNTFQYTDNRISGITVEHYDSSTQAYEYTGEHVLKYDASGNMIVDSVITPPYRYTINYMYDNENRCVKSYIFMINSTDTISIEEFEYHNGDLSKYTSYNVDNAVRQKTLEYEYTYTAKGFVDEATLSLLNSQDQFQLYGLYKHGYGVSGDQLQWMSCRVWNNNRWENSDSIIISFDSNGDPDTSYGYQPGNWNTWASYPNFRFTFDESLATGIQSPVKQSLSFSVYPNPASDKVHINAATTGKMTVQLSDILGNEILKQEMYSGSEMNLENLKPGIYLMKVQSGAQVGTRKLIIQ